MCGWSTLSCCQRKRALLQRPDIVLADEPTGNLDADNSARVVEVLWREVRAAGAALVVATHSRLVADQSDFVVEL